MAYTAPDAADLKERFPAFAAVADDTITQALAEAEIMVDDSWLSQTDFTLGRLLYAAHTMTLDGLGTNGEAQAVGFDVIKSGALMLERRRQIKEGDQSSLAETSYGRRFRDVLRRNVCTIFAAVPSS